ncbi:UvrD-like helicase, ATP-binding domain, P-loop containing nucleoside triphosphate hydrolase [Tanacetum coccineum]
MHIWKFGFNTHFYVQTELIDLYSSLGKIFKSRSVFDEMLERDVFVWTSMVSVLAQSGEMVSAHRLFDEMPERNFSLWNSLIDGYARIKDGALLAGCKLQKNLEIAQIVVNKLMILEHDNSGYYTLLVNMFAEANRCSEVAKLRSAMKYLRVEQKSPGSSWIEIHGKIHQFSASDKYHESSKEIYFMLDELCLCGKLVLAPCVSEHIFEILLTTKSSFVEWISYLPSTDTTFPALQQNVMPAELDILVQRIEDMLCNVKMTEAWIRGSKIIVSDYLPLVALRLVMMLSLIFLQVSDVSKVLLSLLTGEKSIVHLLLKKLVAKLQRRSGSCLNLNPEVVAEAFESVEDRLLIGYSEDRIPQIHPLCAISMDLKKSKQEIMSVLLPRKYTHIGQTSPNNVDAGATPKISSSNTLPEANMNEACGTASELETVVKLCSGNDARVVRDAADAYDVFGLLSSAFDTRYRGCLDIFQSTRSGQSVLLKDVEASLKRLQSDRPKIDKFLNHYVMSQVSKVERTGDGAVGENQSECYNTQDGNKKKGKEATRGRRVKRAKTESRKSKRATNLETKAFLKAIYFVETKAFLKASSD